MGRIQRLLFLLEKLSQCYSNENLSILCHEVNMDFMLRFVSLTQHCWCQNQYEFLGKSYSFEIFLFETAKYVWFKPLFDKISLNVCPNEVQRCVWVLNSKTGFKISKILLYKIPFISDEIFDKLEFFLVLKDNTPVINWNQRVCTIWHYRLRSFRSVYAKLHLYVFFS